MKTQLLTFGIVIGTLNAHPQGTIVFQNRVPGLVITHIYAPLPSDPLRGQTGNGTDDTPPDIQDWTGFTLIGANGVGGPFGGATTFAQLLSAPGFDQPEQSLQPAQPTTTFRTGATAGYLSGVLATLSNVPYDSEATLEMVAWDNSSSLYPTWAQAFGAWQAGLIAAGVSGRWNQLTRSPLSPEPPIIGAVSFNLYYRTPEPSPLGLAALAAVISLAFRRQSASPPTLSGSSAPRNSLIR